MELSRECQHLKRSGSRLLPWKMWKRASALLTWPRKDDAWGKNQHRQAKQTCKSLEHNSHEHTTSFSFRTPLCHFNMGIYTTWCQQFFGPIGYVGFSQAQNHRIHHLCWGHSLHYCHAMLNVFYVCPSYWLTCYDACILLYGNPVNPTIASDRRTPTTPTSVPTPSGNTDPPPLTPCGPRGPSTDQNHTQSEGTYVCTYVIALQ